MNVFVDLQDLISVDVVLDFAIWVLLNCSLISNGCFSFEEYLPFKGSFPFGGFLAFNESLFLVEDLSFECPLFPDAFLDPDFLEVPPRSTALILSSSNIFYLFFLCSLFTHVWHLGNESLDSTDDSDLISFYVQTAAPKNYR